jgi:cation transport protein ChaC
MLARMAITRQDLESDRLRASLCSTPVASSLLTEDAIERSLHCALAERADADGPDGDSGDVWIFGYGSLIWNPMVVHTDRRVASVHGYHRGFYLYSRINRGTWDHPGLVLGLDRGGSCTGMAFRIPKNVIEQEFRVLWRREMMTGAYHPRWLRLKFGDGQQTGPRRALAFVMNRAHNGYAGRLPDDEVVGCLRHACGVYGPARDYLQQTLLGLATHGVGDPYLERLWRQLQERDAREGSSAAPGVHHAPQQAAADAGTAVASTMAPHETV